MNVLSDELTESAGHLELKLRLHPIRVLRSRLYARRISSSRENSQELLSQAMLETAAATA